MPSATMTTKGQLTIPKEVRDSLGLTAGDQVEFTLVPDGSVCMTKHRAYRLQELYGLLPAGSLAPDRDSMRAAAMEEVAEKVTKR
jgi:AbrB family looped-hinge helix DNA binding protein